MGRPPDPRPPQSHAANVRRPAPAPLHGGAAGFPADRDYREPARCTALRCCDPGRYLPDGGVFLAALADGLTPEDAARRANAAAALSATRAGPATSPTRAELDTWLACLPGPRP
jgi:hypothetical protein